MKDKCEMIINYFNRHRELSMLITIILVAIDFLFILFTFIFIFVGQDYLEGTCSLIMGLLLLGILISFWVANNKHNIAQESSSNWSGWVDDDSVSDLPPPADLEDDWDEDAELLREDELPPPPPPLPKEFDVKLKKKYEKLKETKKEDSSWVKGTKFEQFVHERFPAPHFRSTGRTRNYTGRPGQYPSKIDQNRDLEYFYPASGIKIFIECKYRSRLIQDKRNPKRRTLHWASRKKMLRYRKFHKENLPAEFFVLMGLGRKADNPVRLFGVPLDKIRSSNLDINFLEKYELKKDRPIKYLWRRLYN